MRSTITMRLHHHQHLQLQGHLPPLAAPEANRRGHPRSSLNRSRPVSSRSAATRPSAVAVGSGSARVGTTSMPARGTMTTMRTTRPEPRKRGCVSFCRTHPFYPYHCYFIFYQRGVSYIDSHNLRVIYVVLIFLLFTGDLATWRMYHRIMEARRRRETEKAMFESHPDAAAAAALAPTTAQDVERMVLHVRSRPRPRTSKTLPSWRMPSPLRPPLPPPMTTTEEQNTIVTLPQAAPMALPLLSPLRPGAPAA